MDEALLYGPVRTGPPLLFPKPNLRRTFVIALPLSRTLFITVRRRARHYLNASNVEQASQTLFSCSYYPVLSLIRLLFSTVTELALADMASNLGIQEISAVGSQRLRHDEG